MVFVSAEYSFFSIEQRSSNASVTPTQRNVLIPRMLHRDARRIPFCHSFTTKPRQIVPEGIYHRSRNALLDIPPGTPTPNTFSYFLLRAVIITRSHSTDIGFRFVLKLYQRFSDDFPDLPRFWKSDRIFVDDTTIKFNRDYL